MATKKELLRLVRANCSECVGGPRTHEQIWPVQNPSDIDDCSATLCAFYKYRFGTDPDKNPARVKMGQRLAREHGFTKLRSVGKRSKMDAKGKEATQ